MNIFVKLLKHVDNIMCVLYHDYYMNLIDKKEMKILGVLYKKGSLSIGDLSKVSDINRTALYHTLDKMMEKGLITKIQKEHTTHVQALSLEAYQDWSKRNIEEVSNQMNDFQDFLIHQNIETKSIQPEIKYFEGVEGVKHLYADTWRNNTDKHIDSITDYDAAYKVLGKFLEKEYFPDRIKHGVFVHSVLPKNSLTGKIDIKREKELLRKMKFIDIFKDLGIEINVYGSKISIVSFDAKKPSGVIIENKTIANAFTKIFEYIWSK